MMTPIARIKEIMLFCWHYKNTVLRKSVRKISRKPQNTVEDRSKYAGSLKDAGAEVEIASLDQPRQRVVVGSYDQLVSTTVFGYSASINANSRPLKELQRIWGKFNRTSAIRRLRRHLMVSKPTHILAGDPPALAVCAAVCSRIRAKLVYIPFEFYPKHVGANVRQMSRFEALEERHIQDASRIIFLGDSILKYYAEKYPGLATKSEVVYSSWPNCQPDGELLLRKAANIDREKKIVLYQGIIEVDRGLANVVAALKGLPKDTLFVVLGYGSACSALEQQALDMGVRHRLLILPPVPQTMLMSYTKDADVGIIPLLKVKSHYYACPGKLFEYIAAELPLVVSDMPDLKAIVEKYRLGEVYPSDSVDRLTFALSALLGSATYRRKCVANARQAQLTDLCWEKQSAKLCEVVLNRYSKGDT